MKAYVSVRKPSLTRTSSERFRGGSYGSGEWPDDRQSLEMSWLHDRWLQISTLGFPTGEEGRFGIPVRTSYISKANS